MEELSFYSKKKVTIAITLLFLFFTSIPFYAQSLSFLIWGKTADPKYIPKEETDTFEDGNVINHSFSFFSFIIY